MISRFALLFTLAPLFIACGGGGGGTGGAGGTGAGGSVPSIPEVRFELAASGAPDFLSVPWPSDAYLEGDGTIVDTIPGFDAYVTSNAKALEATLGAQKGFGVNVGALVEVVDPSKSDPNRTGPLPLAVDIKSLPSNEAASVADDASVLLLDLDAGTKVPARVQVHDDSDLGATSPPLLSVLPARGVVLAEGHRHAVVVTTKVTAGGKPVAASATFAAIRDGSRRATVTEKLYGAAVDDVKKLVKPLGDGKSIAGLAVFTTQSTSGELVTMREIVAKAKPPTVDWKPADIKPMGAALFADHVVAGYTATLDAWLGTPNKLPDGTDDPATDQDGGAAHDAIAAIGTAVFEAPNFLQQKPGGYTDPEHATVARDAKGDPEIDPDHPTVKIWVTFSLPKGPVPANGFPVVILAHGLQGDRSFMLALANTFAEKGWATAAIDAPTFGARATDPSDRQDKLSNFRWSKNPGAYAGPDGFTDTDASAVSFFAEFQNFGAVRDQLREAVIDIGTLAEVVTDPNLDLGPLLDAVPGAKFDASRLGYLGDSFGSIVGLMVASVDPKIRHFVLNVGGGGVLTEVISNSPSLSSVIGIAAPLYGFSRTRFDDSELLIQLIQGMVDPADPLTHARFIQTSPRAVAGKTNPPKSVVLIEAVWDEIVANEGGEAAARAAGLYLASPNVGSNAGLTFPIAKPDATGIHDVPRQGITAVLVQASPATHGCDLYCAEGKRAFRPPFAPPYPMLPSPFSIHEPYVGLQKMSASFFDAAFAGQTPVVKDFPTPLRDFDGDGKVDDKDKFPFDPNK